MARKAAEEALVRHYSYILAAEPDQELLLRSVFDNAVQRVGPKHLTADPFDPGAGTAASAVAAGTAITAATLHASHAAVAAEIASVHLNDSSDVAGTLCERMRWRKKRAEGQPKEADPAASNKQSKEADEEELAMAQGVVRASRLAVNCTHHHHQL